MTIKNFLKKLWQGRKSKETKAMIHEHVYEAETILEQPAETVQNRPDEPDVDLSPQKDLENYAKGLSISKKSLEQLISSGMLMPDELDVAEKIIKYMRDKDHDSDY